MICLMNLRNLLALTTIKPIALSASGCWLYDHCPEAYRLHYKKFYQPKKNENAKLFISKVVHEIGATWLTSKDRSDWDQKLQIHILQALTKESIPQDKQAFFIEKITDLSERYIELLSRLRLQEKKISTEEMYGCTFKTPIQMTETWSFVGAADIVVFTDFGDSIFDAKWSWQPERLSRNQINIYATAHETILKRPVTTTGFIVFGPQKIVTFNFGQKQKEETLQKMNRITTEIINNKFIASPQPTKCKYCEYSFYCEHKIIINDEGEPSNVTKYSTESRDIFDESL